MAKSKKNESEPEEGVVTFDKESYRQGVAQHIWSHSDTGHMLTVEEQLFCRSYIIDRNPVAALRRLNYDLDVATLKRMAERHLRNTEVQGCVEVLAKRMMDKLDITAEKVNEGLAEIAFSDPGEVMEFDGLGVNLLHSRHWTPGMRRTVQSVKMGQNGVEIKFYDRQKALETLGKQVGVVDDDAKMQREMAEAAAGAAVMKIFEVTERMRSGPPSLKVVKPPEEDVA